MKISDLEKSSKGVSGFHVQDARKSAAAVKTDFQSQLAKAEDSSYQQHLESLVEEIIKKGEKLSKRIDIREFRDYKKLVSEFLDTAVGKSLKFSKRSLLDRKGRHRVYALIRKINEEVDKLAQEVMNGEQDNLSLLRRLDDIRGLILDMLL